MPDFITPPAVEPGDRVAVVAPSSNAPESARFVHELGLERMREVFDLEPVEYPTATADPEWLAENPEARAKDVMDAFRDPNIPAVIANIGGHDQITMLPYLDGDVLREHPTRFYGYSDNTNLSMFLWNLGIVSYYGGSTLLGYAMDGQMFDYTEEYLSRALFDESIGEWHEADVFTDESGDWEDSESVETTRDIEQSDGRIWRGGESTVSGRLWSGCHAVLVEQFLADQYLPDPDALDGTVLVFETSELIPDPAVVGANLRALGERGLLERFDGALIGRAAARSHVEDNPPEWRENYRERQRDAISGVFETYNRDAPVVFDCEFGHTYPTCPIPIGGEAEVDPSTESIHLR
jgi:muramoyltetrapeptide carboxypeptidase LdcA involved in peptidoglycan recycling